MGGVDEEWQSFKLSSVICVCVCVCLCVAVRQSRHEKRKKSSNTLLEW